MGGGYHTHNDIEFKGVPKEYEIQKNESKKRYEISFMIQYLYNSAEQYQVQVHLYTNKTSNINVNSSYRLHSKNGENIH